jgi:hypothetical protein
LACVGQKPVHTGVELVVIHVLKKICERRKCHAGVLACLPGG